MDVLGAVEFTAEVDEVGPVALLDEDDGDEGDAGGGDQGAGVAEGVGDPGHEGNGHGARWPGSLLDVDDDESWVADDHVLLHGLRGPPGGDVSVMLDRRAMERAKLWDLPMRPIG